MKRSGKDNTRQPLRCDCWCDQQRDIVTQDMRDKRIIWYSAGGFPTI